MIHKNGAAGVIGRQLNDVFHACGFCCFRSQSVERLHRILKRGGIEAVTTNRVAEVAGVSIGSVYQYFPDKRAIFAALHEHSRFVQRSIQARL